MREAVANLEFQTTSAGAVAVVAPEGELDLSGARLLEDELERLADEPGVEAVVLDLRGVRFMDSSGLRLVIAADMRMRDAGRRFALVRGPDTVHRVFEITHMSERLEFVADPIEVEA